MISRYTLDSCILVRSQLFDAIARSNLFGSYVRNLRLARGGAFLRVKQTAPYRGASMSHANMNAHCTDLVQAVAATGAYPSISKVLPKDTQQSQPQQQQDAYPLLMRLPPISKACGALGFKHFMQLTTFKMSLASSAPKPPYPLLSYGEVVVNPRSSSARRGTYLSPLAALLLLPPSHAGLDFETKIAQGEDVGYAFFEDDKEKKAGVVDAEQKTLQTNANGKQVQVQGQGQGQGKSGTYMIESKPISRETLFLDEFFHVYVPSSTATLVRPLRGALWATVEAVARGRGETYHAFGIELGRLVDDVLKARGGRLPADRKPKPRPPKTPHGGAGGAGDGRTQTSRPPSTTTSSASATAAAAAKVESKAMPEHAKGNAFGAFFDSDDDVAPPVVSNVAKLRAQTTVADEPASASASYSSSSSSKAWSLPSTAPKNKWSHLHPHIVMEAAEGVSIITGTKGRLARPTYSSETDTVAAELGLPPVRDIALPSLSVLQLRVVHAVLLTEHARLSDRWANVIPHLLELGVTANEKVKAWKRSNAGSTSASSASSASSLQKQSGRGSRQLTRAAEETVTRALEFVVRSKRFIDFGITEDELITIQITIKEFALVDPTLLTKAHVDVLESHLSKMIENASRFRTSHIGVLKHLVKRLDLEIQRRTRAGVSNGRGNRWTRGASRSDVTERVSRSVCEALQAVLLRCSSSSSSSSSNSTSDGTTVRSSDLLGEASSELLEKVEQQQILMKQQQQSKEDQVRQLHQQQKQQQQQQKQQQQQQQKQQQKQQQQHQQKQQHQKQQQQQQQKQQQQPKPPQQQQKQQQQQQQQQKQQQQQQKQQQQRQEQKVPVDQHHPNAPRIHVEFASGPPESKWAKPTTPAASTTSSSTSTSSSSTTAPSTASQAPQPNVVPFPSKRWSPAASLTYTGEDAKGRPPRLFALARHYKSLITVWTNFNTQNRNLGRSVEYYRLSNGWCNTQIKSMLEQARRDEAIVLDQVAFAAKMLQLEKISSSMLIKGAMEEAMGNSNTSTSSSGSLKKKHLDALVFTNKVLFGSGVDTTLVYSITSESKSQIQSAVDILPTIDIALVSQEIKDQLIKGMGYSKFRKELHNLCALNLLQYRQVIEQLEKLIKEWTAYDQMLQSNYKPSDVFAPAPKNVQMSFDLAIQLQAMVLYMQTPEDYAIVADGDNEYPD